MFITEPHVGTLKYINEKNDFYHQIFDNSIDPIYLIEVTPERRFIHIEINPAFFNAVGVSKEEIVNRYVDELEDVALRNTLIQKYTACLNANKKIEYISEFDLPGGHKIYQSTLSPIYDSRGSIHRIAGIAREITSKIDAEKKLKQSEEQLNEAKTKLSALFSSIPDLIWMKDSNGVYQTCNAAFERFFGAPEHEIIGKVDYDYVDKEQADLFRKTDNEAISSGKTVLNEETMTYRADGTTALLETRKIPVYMPNGELLGVLGIARDITERKTIEKKIAFMAHHDALTGLPNRILAKDRMEQAIAHAKRNNNQAALIFIDLDGFKTINDSLGHALGDAMLKSVSSRLSEAIRATDTLSRQGGDEFLMILPDINERNDIVAIVDKLMQEFKKSFQVHNQVITTSASIGIAVFPTHGDSFESLIQNADTAMYQAKELGKNGYCFYTPQMTHNLIGQFTIQNDLKSAIQNNEFMLHYQPQIDLQHNCITGVEALIRWQHPQLGIIPPMSFIPVAESSGLIVPIGDWVLYEACRQGALWQDQGMNITMAVNISAVQFKRGNLETVVKNALASSGLKPQFLELELTESILIHDAENILITVQNLKALGIQLSIDDFGTGYSSLSYLKRFAVDKLKIDQSFVHDILVDQEDAAIVQTIIQMAKSLNLKTIAEGVENAEVLNIIKSYGCNEIQGYHFAKPMEPLHFKKYHKNFNNPIHS